MSTLKEANFRAILLLFGSALLISVTSFLAISKMGIFDVEFHVPLALAMFHNNVYPPRDFFRPEFVLLYDCGGDIFVGASIEKRFLSIAFFVTSYMLRPSGGGHGEGVEVRSLREQRKP